MNPLHPIKNRMYLKQKKNPVLASAVVVVNRIK